MRWAGAPSGWYLPGGDKVNVLSAAATTIEGDNHSLDTFVTAATAATATTTAGAATTAAGTAAAAATATATATTAARATETTATTATPALTTTATAATTTTATATTAATATATAAATTVPAARENVTPRGQATRTGQPIPPAKPHPQSPSRGNDCQRSPTLMAPASEPPKTARGGNSEGGVRGTGGNALDDERKPRQKQQIHGDSSQFSAHEGGGEKSEEDAEVNEARHSNGSVEQGEGYGRGRRGEHPAGENDEHMDKEDDIMDGEVT